MRSFHRNLKTALGGSIRESARARDIPPALLPADDAGEGFAGRVDLGKGDGEWQWLVRQAGRDVAEGAAGAAADARREAEAVALKLG